MACPEPRKHVAIRARHPRSLLGGCVEATGASETRTHNVYKHAVDRSTQRLLDKMGADHGDYQEPW